VEEKRNMEPMIYVSLGILVIYMNYIVLRGHTAKAHRIYLEELQELTRSLVEQLDSRRIVAEELISKKLVEADRILAEKKVATDAENAAALQTLKDSLTNMWQQAQEEYKLLETHFRTSIKDDTTSHLLACAYAVASGKHPVRDIKDAELIRAVVAHRNVAGPGAFERKDFVPPKDDLN